MSGNKKVKDAMIRLYGDECFIEKLKLRDTSGLTYKGKAQYKRMKMLTYHHIRQKARGGKATIENGALLSAENHQWFHQQPKAEQERMNNMTPGNAGLPKPKKPKRSTQANMAMSITCLIP